MTNTITTTDIFVVLNKNKIDDGREEQEQEIIQPSKESNCHYQDHRDLVALGSMPFSTSAKPQHSSTIATASSSSEHTRMTMVMTQSSSSSSSSLSLCGGEKDEDHRNNNSNIFNSEENRIQNSALYAPVHAPVYAPQTAFDDSIVTIHLDDQEDPSLSLPLIPMPSSRSSNSHVLLLKSNSSASSSPSVTRNWKSKYDCDCADDTSSDDDDGDDSVCSNEGRNDTTTNCDRVDDTRNDIDNNNNNDNDDQVETDRQEDDDDRDVCPDEKMQIPSPWLCSAVSVCVVNSNDKEEFRVQKGEEEVCGDHRPTDDDEESAAMSWFMNTFPTGYNDNSNDTDTDNTESSSTLSSKNEKNSSKDLVVLKPKENYHHYDDIASLASQLSNLMLTIEEEQEVTFWDDERNNEDLEEQEQDENIKQATEKCKEKEALESRVLKFYESKGQAAGAASNDNDENYHAIVGNATALAEKKTDDDEDNNNDGDGKIENRGHELFSKVTKTFIALPQILCRTPGEYQHRCLIHHDDSDCDIINDDEGSEQLLEDNDNVDVTPNSATKCFGDDLPTAQAEATCNDTSELFLNVTNAFTSLPHIMGSAQDENNIISIQENEKSFSTSSNQRRIKIIEQEDEYSSNNINIELELNDVDNSSNVDKEQDTVIVVDAVVRSLRKKKRLSKSKSNIDNNKSLLAFTSENKYASKHRSDAMDVLMSLALMECCGKQNESFQEDIFDKMQSKNVVQPLLTPSICNGGESDSAEDSMDNMDSSLKSYRLSAANKGCVVVAERISQESEDDNDSSYDYGNSISTRDSCDSADEIHQKIAAEKVSLHSSILENPASDQSGECDEEVQQQKNEDMIQYINAERVTSGRWKGGRPPSESERFHGLMMDNDSFSIDGFSFSNESFLDNNDTTSRKIVQSDTTKGNTKAGPSNQKGTTTSVAIMVPLRREGISSTVLNETSSGMPTSFDFVSSLSSEDRIPSPPQRIKESALSRSNVVRESGQIDPASSSLTRNFILPIDDLLFINYPNDDYNLSNKNSIPSLKNLPPANPSKKSVTSVVEPPSPVVLPPSKMNTSRDTSNIQTPPTELFSVHQNALSNGSGNSNDIGGAETIAKVYSNMSLSLSLSDECPIPPSPKQTSNSSKDLFDDILLSSSEEHCKGKSEATQGIGGNGGVSLSESLSDEYPSIPLSPKHIQTASSNGSKDPLFDAVTLAKRGKQVLPHLHINRMLRNANKKNPVLVGSNSRRSSTSRFTNLQQQHSIISLRHIAEDSLRGSERTCFSLAVSPSSPLYKQSLLSPTNKFDDGEEQEQENCSPLTVEDSNLEQQHQPANSSSCLVVGHPVHTRHDNLFVPKSIMRKRNKDYASNDEKTTTPSSCPDDKNTVKQQRCGSARVDVRVHWDEAQLANKVEKGVMFPLNRKSRTRSIYALKQLMLEITAVQDGYGGGLEQFAGFQHRPQGYIC
uniref:Uncharacterized protein n=1 Tax=Pseudo-nitzschia australis TaxID=44445 RepID=A0A7S4AIA8_9STRA